MSPKSQKYAVCLRYSYQLRPKALEWRQIVLRIVDFQGDKRPGGWERQKRPQKDQIWAGLKLWGIWMEWRNLVMGWGLVAEMHPLSGKQGDGELGRSSEKAGLMILSSRRWNVTKITWRKNVLKSRGVAGKRVLPWPGCRKQRTGAEPACLQPWKELCEAAS